MLRSAFIMAALDAGVPLREVQIAARHADPRTTTIYDRRRANFDHHAAYVVVAFVAGGVLLAGVSSTPALGPVIVSLPGRPGALRCGDLPCQFRLTNQGCQSKLTHMDIEQLSVNLSSDDPAIGLRASLALHRLAERVEANHVASARGKGWSWQQIGDALGVTRQSVHTKYNKESS
jgi:hypothetical protein